MATEDGLEIPARPERRYPYGGPLEYEGGAVAELTPPSDRQQSDLIDLVEGVFDAGPYVAGDFFDLPMPVWLVRDRETGDSFRVSVRDGRVRLHPIPTTQAAGLAAFRDRLRDRDGATWGLTWIGAPGSDR